MGSKSIKDVWGENKVMDYIEKYIILGKDLNDCTTKEDVKRHNIAMKNLSKLYKEIELVSDKTFLLLLLENQNIHLRALVAAHCLGMNIYIPEAKKTLKKIAHQNSNQIMAFNAQATLDVWKKQGYLNF